MPQVKQGDTVKFHYRGTLDDGLVFDSSHGGDPEEVKVGDGQIMPMIEAALIGMAAGETKTFTITPDDAYGPRNEELVMAIERTRFPDGIELQVGESFQTEDEDGQSINLTVVAFTDDNVTVDLNHPLAGATLNLEIQVLEVV